MREELIEGGGDAHTPLQELARILFETMRHLDASTDKEWDDLNRSDQDWYETCVEKLMQDRTLVRRYFIADDEDLRAMLKPLKGE